MYAKNTIYKYLYPLLFGAGTSTMALVRFFSVFLPNNNYFFREVPSGHLGMACVLSHGPFSPRPWEM